MTFTCKKYDNYKQKVKKKKSTIKKNIKKRLQI